MSTTAANPADIAPTHLPEPVDIVDIPAGVRHYQTDVFAVSWDTYDDLAADSRFEKRGWWVAPNSCSKCEPGTEGARWHEQLASRTFSDGHLLIVYPPTRPRDETIAVPGRDDQHLAI